MTAEAEIPRDVLNKAQAKVRKFLLDAGHPVHTVYQGLIEKDGVETGQIGIVVEVEDKMQARRSEPIPKEIPVEGYMVRVDIQESPPHIQARMPLNPHPVSRRFSNRRLQQWFAHGLEVQAQNAAWQQCFDIPMMGGIQIAPEGAGWVGTLSCAFAFNVRNELIYGGLTNYHVAVLAERIGLKIRQPHGGGGSHIATLYAWGQMNFKQRDAKHYIDAAVIDTRVDVGGGKILHTVKPSQYKIIENNGIIIPTVKDFKINDLCVKTGRTTGVVRGKCTGVNAESYVGYDEGTLLFVGQDVFKADGGGDLSAPGDSGSLILHRSMHPGALLYAGGGGSTLGNPIRFVIQAFKGQFFAVAA